MEIGTAIRQIRKSKKIKQKDLAIAIDISNNALCQIEKNNNFPHKSTLDKICYHLEISVAYLLLFSIEDKDIPVGKKFLFKHHYKVIMDTLLWDGK